MTTDISLNGVALSTAVPEAIVLVIERPLVGKRRHETVDAPGRAGSWTFNEEPGDRVLSVDLDLQGDSFDDRRDAVRRLADWCDLGAVAAFIADDEPDRYHSVLLDDDTNPAEWLVRATITLRFRAGPYALALAPTTEELTITDGHLTAVLNVPGDVDAEAVFEIDPNGNGYIDGFTLTVNDDMLTVLGPFGADQIVTVSAISDTVTVGPSGDELLTGAFNPADISMGQVSGRFPVLVPGDNDIALDMEATATPALLRIIWRRRYR